MENQRTEGVNYVKYSIFLGKQKSWKIKHWLHSGKFFCSLSPVNQRLNQIRLKAHLWARLAQGAGVAGIGALSLKSLLSDSSKLWVHSMFLLAPALSELLTKSVEEWITPSKGMYNDSKKSKYAWILGEKQNRKFMQNYLTFFNSNYTISPRE